MLDLEKQFWELKVENEKALGEMRTETERNRAETEKRIAQTERSTRNVFVWGLPILTVITLAFTILKVLEKV